MRGSKCRPVASSLLAGTALPIALGCGGGQTGGGGSSQPPSSTTAMITVSGTPWGTSTQYIGANEGEQYFNAAEVKDLGINTYRIYRSVAQVSKAKLRILPTGVRQILRDQFAEPEPLVEFAHQPQAAAGSDARTLKTDLETGIEGKLKRPVLFLTHWVLTSGTSSPRSHSHKH
jgi:hypothetical protein